MILFTDSTVWVIKIRSPFNPRFPSQQNPSVTRHFFHALQLQLIYEKNFSILVDSELASIRNNKGSRSSSGKLV